MSSQTIFDEKGEGFTRIFSHDKVEHVNPIEYFKSHELKKRTLIIRDLLYAKNPLLTSMLDDAFFLQEAEKSLLGFFEQFEQTEVHENFLELLATSRKRDQIKLLKGMSLILSN